MDELLAFDESLETEAEELGPCPECDGSGTVTIYIPESEIERTPEEEWEEPCPVCGGLGLAVVPE